jgi:hypothetical protein
VAIGLTGDANKLIKGYNSVSFNANATAQKEASIASYEIINGSQKKTTATGKMDNVNNGTFTFKVTDSRGNSTTKTVTKTMINYVPLTCNLSTSAELADSTTAKITLNISGNYYKGSFGAKNNTLTIKYRYKTNSGNYGDWVSSNATITYKNNTYSLTDTITGLGY